MKGFHGGKAACEWPETIAVDEVWDYSRTNVARSCQSLFLPPGFTGRNGTRAPAASGRLFLGRATDRKPECLQRLTNVSFVHNVFSDSQLRDTLNRHRTLVNLHKSWKLCNDSSSAPVEAARVSQVLSISALHVVSERSDLLDEREYEGILSFSQWPSISELLDAPMKDEGILARQRRFQERFEPTRLVRGSGCLRGWCDRFRADGALPLRAKSLSWESFCAGGAVREPNHTQTTE